MVQSVLSLGERVLSLVVPKAEAAACCAPDCWTEASCAGSCIVDCYYCYNCKCQAVLQGCSTHCSPAAPC